MMHSGGMYFGLIEFERTGCDATTITVDAEKSLDNKEREKAMISGSRGPVPRQKYRYRNIKVID